MSAAANFGVRPGGSVLAVALIAVMSLLTALALAGGLATGAARAGLDTAVEHGATVQVVEPEPAAAERQVRAVAGMLAREPEVSAVRVVPPAESAKLLEPWLGAAAVSDGALPIPRLIDLRLGDGAAPALIERRLRAVAPSARLQVHARWLAPLARLLTGLSALSAAVVAIVVLATAAVVALGTRAALGNQAEVIDLLHVMGAEDADIARVFQYRYLRDGFLGGLAGVLCACGVTWVLAGGAARLGLAGPAPASWAALALVPPAVALLAGAVARASVAAALRARL